MRKALFTGSTHSLEAMNASAGIGHNNAPEIDPDFISARMIEKGARVLQWIWPSLDNILAKRKGGAELGFRHVLLHCLQGIVPQQVVADCVGLNRKTAGEGAARPSAWADEDEWFSEHLERVRQIVVGYASLDEATFAERIQEFVATDPERRRAAERLKAECEAAAKKADAAADKLERQRLDRLSDLRKSVRSHPRRDAIIAEQEGPKQTARKASEAALVVLEALSIREPQLCDDKRKKVSRLTMGELNTAGANECIRLGLAQSAEPYLSKSNDPMVKPTPFGLRVYLEAIASGRVKPVKRRRGE